MSKGTHTSVKNERLLATGKHKIYLPRKLKSQEAILSNSSVVLSEVTTGYQ